MTEVDYYKAIDLLTRPAGCTILDLEEQLGRSRRTIYRLLDRLEEMGFPIYDERSLGRTKTWRLEERFVQSLSNIRLPTLSLERDEVILLNVMLGKESVLSDSGFASTLQSLREKITKWSIGGNGTDSTQKNQSTSIAPLFNGRKCYRGSEQILDDLLSAIGSRHICTTRYHAFGKDRILDLILRPIKIFEWNRGLYLYCYLEPDLPVRMLAIERFQSVVVESESFPIPDDIPEKAMERAFAVTWDDPFFLKVRFTAAKKLYVQSRQWSPDQKFEDQEDGSTILSMNTSGFGDVLSWILSFGSDATVMEPPRMIEAVLVHLRKSQENY